MSDGPLLTTDSVACGRDGKVLIEEVNLTLNAGQVTALVGPNGSGKTTLLETLSGTLEMYGGSIELDGRSLHKISSRERAQMIGYVPQREEPLFEFSVREVAAMGRIPHSTGLNETEEDWEAVDQALEQTDVARLAEKSVMRISGGELQRTLIARAIAQGPKILLLDEPTASLDIPHWHDLSKIIRSLTASGTAVVISSHDINWALPLADSVICLNKNGTWQGPPSAAKSHLEEAFGIRLEAVMLSSGQTALYPVKPN